MFERSEKFAAATVVSVLLVCGGCEHKPVATSPGVERPVASADPAATASEESPALEEFYREYADSVNSLPDHRPGPYLAAVNETPVVMTGSVEHKGWSKSMESWKAGGSDYYVLVRDDHVKASHLNRVIMRPSPAFRAIDEFKAFAGKRIELRGRWAATYKFKLPDGMQQPSMMPGQEYHVGGGGLLVDEIRVLGESRAEVR